MTSAYTAPIEIDRDADARWTRWLAKGAQHDRVTVRRARAAAAFLGIGLAGWLIALLLR